jgi:hypothetical protein
MNVWSFLNLPDGRTYLFRRLHLCDHIPSDLGLIATTMIGGVDVEFLSIEAANDMAQECKRHGFRQGKKPTTGLAICRVPNASLNDLVEIAQELRELHLSQSAGKAA